MHKCKLTCFGTGHGWPTARNHSSFLYQIGSVTLLLDCGEPVSSSFFKTGLPYNAIDRIFISHLHFDHVGGFFMLMQGFWLKRQKRDLIVHLPADGVAPIRQLLNGACVFDELLAFQLQFEALRAREPVTVGNVQMRAFPTTHLDTFRQRFASKYQQGYEAFSFLIESEGLRIGHSADIGAIQDLDPLVAQPLDLLVCELAHVNPEQLFRYLEKCDIGRFVFVHLTDQQYRDVESLRELAAKYLGQAHTLCFACDGEEITI